MSLLLQRRLNAREVFMCAWILLAFLALAALRYYWEGKMVHNWSIGELLQAAATIRKLRSNTSRSRHVEFIPDLPNQAIRDLIPEARGGKKRILWWNTVFQKHAQFYGVGWLPDVRNKIARACSLPCEFVVDRSLVNTSHAVIFHAWPRDLEKRFVLVKGRNVTRPKGTPKHRRDSQYYVYWCHETPIRIVNWSLLQPYNDFFNWTVSYRLDSDFPFPYGRVVRKKNQDVKKYNTKNEHKKILKGKTQLVAWIVSNCNHSMSARMEIVTELQKHIPVHVYGKCGSHVCNKSNCHEEVGKSYKFYLAFENSLCLDYVTEKFFNSLKHNMVPIVYGKANYGHQFPPGSFINVDSFPSASALANHLRFLDKYDSEYIKYFGWRRTHVVFSNEKETMPIFCDICKRVHKDYGKKKSLLDLQKWLFKDRGEYAPICTKPQMVL